MELLTIIVTCFVLLSFIFAPCPSDQLPVKKSIEKGKEFILFLLRFVFNGNSVQAMVDETSIFLV